MGQNFGSCKHLFGEEERAHLNVSSILFLLGPLLKVLAWCPLNPPVQVLVPNLTQVLLSEGLELLFQPGTGAGAGGHLPCPVLTHTARVAAGKGFLGDPLFPELEICARQIRL